MPTETNLFVKSVSGAEGGANDVPLVGERRGVARARFSAGVANVLGGQAGVAALALGMEICYARLIGPSGRGQISLCMMTIAVAAMLGGLGGEIPIITWSADRKKQFSDWLPAVCLAGIAGCFGAVALWALVYWRWHPSFLRGITPVLAGLVLATIPVTVCFDYILALFTGREDFGQRAKLILFSQTAEFVCVCVLLFAAARSAEMAMLGNLAGVLLAGIAGGYMLRVALRDSWRLNRARKTIRSAVSLGVRGQFGNLATLVSYRLDVFVVNFFLSPAQVGLYALGVLVSESLWQIPNAVAVALFPRTARTLEADARQFTCFVSRQVLFLAVLMGLTLAIVSPVAIPLVFGARFGASVAVVWWILPGTIALSASKVLSADITARGRPEYNSIVALAGGAVTIVLDFVLIPRMGIRGAALASSITYSLEAILIVITARNLLGTTWSELLIPARSDFAVYRRVWREIRTRLLRDSTQTA